jgi:hypothetical protein
MVSFKKKWGWGLGIVTHIYNPSYLEAEITEDHSSRQARQKVYETPISTNGWEQWCCHTNYVGSHK